MAIEPIACATTAADLAYVRAEFVTLEQLARDRPVPLARMRAWAGVALPRATYVLPDGELRFARDWWRLFDEAGGIEGVRPEFERRYRASVGSDAALADEWDAYIAGLYGACLHEVTPEHVVAKARLVARLESALAMPRPEDATWCRELRANVAALDALARPFAACDRERFGRPTSRDRLIDLPRRIYTAAFVTR